jgi:hypothetical protein
MRLTASAALHLLPPYNTRGKSVSRHGCDALQYQFGLVFRHVTGGGVFI